MIEGIADVAVEWHQRVLRRYIRLHIGAPEGFTCRGGWHEAFVALGDYPGEVERGSDDERALTPPEYDPRWPKHCDGCSYRFTERDRFQLLTAPACDPGE